MLETSWISETVKAMSLSSEYLEKKKKLNEEIES